MSKYCEYCSHSLEEKFNCLRCIHFYDDTNELEDLFALSPSIVFCKGTPEWIKEVEDE